MQNQQIVLLDAQNELLFSPAHSQRNVLSSCPTTGNTKPVTEHCPMAGKDDGCRGISLSLSTQLHLPNCSSIVKFITFM